MILARRAFIKNSAGSFAVLPFLKAAARTIKSHDEMMGAPKFVNVNGIRTRYFERGSGEAVVLIHGGGFGANSSADSWSLTLDGLSKHFHVYAFDKLGHGHTDNPKRDEDYTMSGVIQHAYDFLRAMQIQKVTLIGHSRGALPAARIAVDHPEMVTSLVLFDSNTLAPDDPETEVDFHVKRGLGGSGSGSRTYTKESTGRSMEDFYYSKDKITDDYVEAVLRIALLPKVKEAEERLKLLTSRFVERNPEKVKQNPSLGIMTAPSPWWVHDVKEETLAMIKAGRLKAPTLIVWGFNDLSAPYKLGIELVKTIFPVARQMTRFQIFNRAAHYVYREHPEEVNRLLVDFIQNSSST